jgi:hypothetical protein
MVIKASKKQSKEIRNMFRFYDIDCMDYYPFISYKKATYCLFSSFSAHGNGISRLRAYYLSLIKYQLIPFSFTYEAEISVIADFLLNNINYNIGSEYINRIKNRYLNV